MDLEKLDRDYPEKQFLVHDGYCPWMYGVPMDPTIISIGTACKILRQIVGKSGDELVREVQSEGPPPLQYAEEDNFMYEETGQNRFIVFMNLEKCVFEDKTLSLKCKYYNG